MRKFYMSGLISACFALLVGCHTVCSTDTHHFHRGNPDEAITASVNSALSTNQDLSALGIHVATQQGAVALSGYVKTIRQLDTAGEVASKVPGVRTVQNNLIVRK
jgi:hyperosmotically inducible periplasmic protein